MLVGQILRCAQNDNNLVAKGFETGSNQTSKRFQIVRPGDAILIEPGCRHRAIGKLRVLNIPVPAFDPADEWFD